MSRLLKCVEFKLIYLKFSYNLRLTSLKVSVNIRSDQILHRPIGGSVTKYRIECVDCIITGGRVRGTARETALRCTAPRANADVDGDDITECTGRVQTEPLRTTRGSMC